MINEIKVINLTKKFKKLVAVDNISFEIKRGEIFGLLGPNGAGKTTTLSMLSTLQKPSSGTAIINGFDILKDEDNVRRSIGIVFQDQSLDEELTANENMQLHSMLYHIPKNQRKKKIEELLKLVGLFDRRNDLVKTFSGGMRRRLEIARGLLHTPKVLFLDEPTLGLDPQTRNQIWEYIKKLNKRTKITIIITTHYMDEADKLCNRIAIIDKGKIIALNTSSELKNEVGEDIITIKSNNAKKLKEIICKDKELKCLDANDGIINVNIKNAEKHVAEIINLATTNDIKIESVSMHKPTLEDVFLHFTGKSIREEGAKPKNMMRGMMRR